MINAEEVLQVLEEFSKSKQHAIPLQLDNYLAHVALTGDLVYQWPVVKCLFKAKLNNVLSNFSENPNIIPQLPNTDPFEFDTVKEKLLECLNSFVAAPFTIQRICELLMCPFKHYKRIDKFMRAFEKNIYVVGKRETVEQNYVDGDYADSNKSNENSSHNHLDQLDVEMTESSLKGEHELNLSNKVNSLDNFKEKTEFNVTKEPSFKISSNSEICSSCDDREKTSLDATIDTKLEPEIVKGLSDHQALENPQSIPHL